MLLFAATLGRCYSGVVSTIPPHAMSDLRFDPVSGHWVSIATNRNDRPFEYVPVDQVVKRPLCPFCAGNESNESETPLQILAYDAAGSLVSKESDLWSVRVVANKYPSFSVVSANGKASEESPVGDSAYGHGNSHGVQELIIPTPRHVVSLGELSETESRLSIRAAQSRITTVRDADQMKHAMLFTNCRSAAGASLEHIHTQLIASPIQSIALTSRCERNQEHLSKKGTSLLESIARWEIEKQERVIEQSEHFSVLCPYASRFPFQTWIVPKVSETTFENTPEAVADELGNLIRRHIQRLETILVEPAYNVLFHMPPFDSAENNPWFVEILPRLTTPAGYELGTDIWINPVAPETASRRFRQVEQNEKST